MSADYSTLLKNARLDLVDDFINVSPPGELHIAPAGGFGTILATIVLANPAAPAAAAGVLTLTMPQSDSSADNTGTATQARIQDGAALDVVTGLTVGVGSEDIVLDSVSITQLQTVTINSATITHA